MIRFVSMPAYGRMLLVCALLTALVISAPGVCDEVIYVSAGGEGTGLSRHAALQDAFTEAVGRINGIQIATQCRDELGEWAISNNEQSRSPSPRISTT
jgi:hypothetical protein